MPVTLTIKNIPDAVYERLRASADAHGLSIEGEAIICLETALLRQRARSDAHLSSIRKMRANLCFMVTNEDVDALKRDGRP